MEAASLASQSVVPATQTEAWSSVGSPLGDSRKRWAGGLMRRSTGLQRWQSQTGVLWNLAVLLKNLAVLYQRVGLEGPPLLAHLPVKALDNRDCLCWTREQGAWSERQMQTLSCAFPQCPTFGPLQSPSPVPLTDRLSFFLRLMQRVSSWLKHISVQLSVVFSQLFVAKLPTRCFSLLLVCSVLSAWTLGTLSYFAWKCWKWALSVELEGSVEGAAGSSHLWVNRSWVWVYEAQSDLLPASNPVASRLEL